MNILKRFFWFYILWSFYTPVDSNIAHDTALAICGFLITEVASAAILYAL